MEELVSIDAEKIDVVGKASVFCSSLRNDGFYRFWWEYERVVQKFREVVIVGED